MKTLTKVLIATAMLGAFAAPAFAQDTMNSEAGILMKDGDAMYVGANGKVHKFKSTSKEANAMMMEKGTAVPAGAIFHWSGGKLYMIQDAKMADGKMMSDRYFGAEHP
jgi:hypothetical protein